MKKLLIIILSVGIWSCKKEAQEETPAPSNPCIESCRYVGEWFYKDATEHNISVRSVDANTVEVLVPFTSVWIKAVALSSWNTLVIMGDSLYSGTTQNEVVHGYLWKTNNESQLHIKIERDYWDYSYYSNHMRIQYEAVCQRR